MQDGGAVSGTIGADAALCESTEQRRIGEIYISCFNHIPQIKRALGISGVYTEESAWIRGGDESARGAQIDMIIEEEKIRIRKNAVSEAVHSRKSVHPVLITNNSLKPNAHSTIFQKVITVRDLMAPSV